MAAENFQLFSVRRFTVIVFSSLIALIAGDLQVFDGPTDVTNRVLVSEKNDCLPSLDLDASNSSVGSPRHLNLTLYDAPSSVYKGATFRWRPPYGGGDRKNLTGFYVEIKGNRSGDRCSLYTFNNSGFGDMKLRFRLNMENFSRATDDFAVCVYSIPPLKANKSSYGTEQFAFLYLRTKVSPNNIYPTEWSPSIAYKYKPLDKKVYVHISLPPKEEDWLYMHFNVLLVFCSNGHSNSEPYSVKEDRNTTDTIFSFTLPYSPNPKGFYRIVVEVKNYSRSSGVCVCGTKSANCGSTCAFTRTKPFTLSELPSQPQSSSGCEYYQTPPIYTSAPSGPSPPSNPSLPPKSSSTSNSTEKPEVTKDNASSEGDDSKTVTIVVTTCTLILFIAAVVLVCLIIVRRYRRKNAQEFIDNEQPNEKPYALVKATEMAVILPPAKELLRKTVFIVAAPDHPEAVRLLKSFCTFLKAHCQCDVINPSDLSLSQTCDRAWLTSKMRSSDYVIFVNSRETGMLLDIFLSDTKSHFHRPQSVGLKALDFSFSSDELKSKFISVSFNQDWCKDKLAILQPKKFLLPRQLPHFLRGLHNLSESEAEKYEGQLPLNTKCLENLPEWQPFLEAIREEKSFEKKNRLLPENNDDGVASRPSTRGFNGPLSVSMIDLTSNSDNPEPSMAKSPSSVPLKDPDNCREVDKNFSNIHAGLLDGMSSVTVGKESAMTQNSESKNLNQSAFSSPPRATNDYSNVHKPSHSLPPVIPPQRNIKYSNGDTMSNVISRLNDNLSIWYKQPDNATIDRKEGTKDGSEKPLPSSPPIIPPKGKLDLSNGDTMSNVISRLNDNSSVWSKQPGFGTIDQKEGIKDGFEKPLPSSPSVIPPKGKLDLSNGDTMSNVISRFNDNLSVWSKQPGFGTIDQKENGEESEKSSHLVNQPRIIKPPRSSIPTDNLSAILQAFNKEDNAKCFRKASRELDENATDEMSV